MNPCDSTHPATAPYYREARVTVARRQTACRMRHCCARRIVETGGRRKLGCTSTRWAERQRMIEAEANRIATPNAATPRYGQCNRQALQLFELLACNGKRLSFGRATSVFFLGKENGGRITRHLCRIDIRTCAKKEEFSFEKENIPLSRIPCTVQGKNPSPFKGYHLLPVNKKSAPRFSKTARNIRFANPSPHA